MTQRADLIARLQAATEGSRHLDYEVLKAAGYRVEQPSYGQGGHMHGGKSFIACLPGLDDLYLEDAQTRVTTSIDAIVGLIETLLPEHEIDLVIDRPRIGIRYSVMTHKSGDDVLQHLGASGPVLTAPLAFCIALLKALEAKAEASDAALNP